MKPKIFIASSIEGLGIAYAAQQNLHHCAEVTVWDQGVFTLSSTALDSLLAVISTADFGIFIFTADDLIKIRGKEHPTVRDNVLFELGMFIGRLGKERNFIFVPDGSELHLPTDLLGLTPAKFETDRTDGSITAACGPACHSVREAVKRLGFVQRIKDVSETGPEPEVTEKVSTVERAVNLQEGKPTEDLWIDAFFKKEYDQAIELLNKEIEKASTESEKYNFRCWIAVSSFERDGRTADQHFQNLITNNPEKAEAYTWWSICYMWAELNNRALEIIEQGLARFPGSEDLINQKAQLLKRLGNAKWAIDLLHSAIRANPLSVPLREKLASLLIEEKKPIDARAQLVEGITLNPKSETLWSKLAQLLCDEGDNLGAIVAYRKLKNWFETNSTYPTMLGNAYLNLGFLNLAMENYREGDKRAGGKQSWILGNIGNLLNRCGLHSEAATKLREALQLDSESQYAHERLVSAMTGKKEEQTRIDALLESAPPILTSISVSQIPLSSLVLGK
jgi:tetratricopeptide (TPR) repeat protein